MEITKILISLVLLFIACSLTIHGLIYKRQAIRLEQEVGIFLPKFVKLLLYLWVILGTTTLIASIIVLVISIFYLETK